MAMDNFSSVSIRGAFNFARARVLYRDGLLKVFGKDGPLLEVMSFKPTKRPGHVWVWDATTAKGQIEIRNKCITCGGRAWGKVVFMPADQLWSMEW